MAASETAAQLPPPAPPGCKYRPFQLEAIIAARTRNNLLIADEMGLGKSVETIGVINDHSDIRKILIICPASLKLNWHRELIKWLARRTTTLGIASPRSGFPSTDIIIINYESLKPFHRNIHAVDWDLLVCDEAHYMKNQNSNRALEVLGREHKDPMKFRERLDAKRALFLTGTPIVNRPSELFPLVHYLAPEAFPDKLEFLAEFCGGSARGQKKQLLGEENLKRLHQLLRETVMIRRLKRDVLTELPPKIRQVIVLPANAIRGAINKEQKRYREIQAGLSLIRMKAELAKAVDNDAIYAEAVKELRQAEFVTIQQITTLRMQTAMAKVPLVVDHVLQLLQHVPKVVVFAHHTAIIENIATEFGKAVVVVHGKISTEKRQQHIDRFQTDPTCRVLVGAMKASGEGHTLTAAQIVAFCEIDWTPSGLSQCEDRLHRIGQQGSVLVQHLVLDGSIDAMITSRVVEKQETIATVLDDNIETQESLYHLSRATPFVEEDRDAILAMSTQLHPSHIAKVHQALLMVVARGPRRQMSMLDFTIMSMLANLDALEPAQAALGLALIKKHSG
jgi:SWI/SNF-related matrix-associated actin-dependent regulator 1 of chromatin subfamily A